MIFWIIIYSSIQKYIITDNGSFSTVTKKLVYTMSDRWVIDMNTSDHQQQANKTEGSILLLHKKEPILTLFKRSQYER